MKHFSPGQIKASLDPLPKPAGSRPWRDRLDVPLAGPPHGFITEDRRSRSRFVAVAFIDDLTVSLGGFRNRREAACAIAEVHGGGHE
jgi:hypothetical protein